MAAAAVALNGAVSIAKSMPAFGGNSSAAVPPSSTAAPACSSGQYRPKFGGSTALCTEVSPCRKSSAGVRIGGSFGLGPPSDFQFCIDGGRRIRERRTFTQPCGLHMPWPFSLATFVERSWQMGPVMPRSPMWDLTRERRKRKGVESAKSVKEYTGKKEQTTKK